ncbi:MAG: phage tail protein, partial [Deltaproteobacteria bacterium]|nr:phage tail protein [Deltaproteobacteria bacterium]
ELEDANGNRLSMTGSGTTIEDTNGNKVELNAKGISVHGAKVVVKGSQVHLGDEGGEPLIKGQSFLSLFATHVHSVAPVVGGPTSPPIPQGEISALSTSVKTI